MGVHRTGISYVVSAASPTRAERPGATVGVVIPAGPRDDLADTLRSVLAFTSNSRRVVVVDDTQGQRRSDISWASDQPDVTVTSAPARSTGGQGGLWVKVAHGYRRLLSECRPRIVLRLDADALVLGTGLEPAALAQFDGKVGLLGSYQVAADGGTRDFTWAARQLRREMGVRGRIARPQVRQTLRMLYAEAIVSGYLDGHHPLGGAYIHSGEAAEAINRSGLFDLPELTHSRLGEDHLMALVTYAAGFGLADFGGPNDPLALRWKGLPSAPQELLRRGALVTHSVRSWEDMNESEIRRALSVGR